MIRVLQVEPDDVFFAAHGAGVVLVDEDQQGQQPFLMDRGMKEFDHGFQVEVLEQLRYGSDLDKDITFTVLSGACFEKCLEGPGFGRACVLMKLSSGVSMIHNFNDFNVVCSLIQGYDFIYE